MRQREATWLVMALIVALLGCRLAWAHHQRDAALMERWQSEGASSWRPLDATGVLRHP